MTNAQPPDGGTAVAITDVSVRYRRPHGHSASIKHYAIGWLTRRVRFEDFWALRDITLDVARGQAFAIIGPNGSGKSTLMKVVARVLKPARGRVRVFGHVAPLLELGAGFDMELTGRENVFLNGTILGFRRADLERRFDRIVEFAGLRDAIDAPLRTYSSGMLARLGFSIATDVTPEILLLDELLAVGDADFQTKSRDRLAAIRASGTTILMVSHDMTSVQHLCSGAAWLQEGRLEAVGPVADVVDRYLAAPGRQRRPDAGAAP